MTINPEFQAIEVWFTDQNSQPLEIEDFCPLLKTWAINIAKTFFILLKTSTTAAIKTASKKTFQKTEKITGDLIVNKNWR